MTKKIQSVKLVHQNISLLLCPYCGGPVRVVDYKTLVCQKNHTFDFAKQGYLNLLTSPNYSNYKKELYEARNHIIQSGLFAPLHESIAELIKEYTASSMEPFMVADLGCGEGSHLQYISMEWAHSPWNGFGLDISKEAIALAAKKYVNHIWLVGDLAHMPFAVQSFHVLLNILSPSNYREFKRIMVPGGIVIKVVPRSQYLKELRDVLYANNINKRTYNNRESVELFKKHFHLKEVRRISYTQNVRHNELVDLVAMTPLAWTSDQGCMDTFINQEFAQITIDLDILVGFNKEGTQPWKN